MLNISQIIHRELTDRYPILKPYRSDDKNVIYSFYHQRAGARGPQVEAFNDMLFAKLCGGEGAFVKHLLTKEELKENGFQGACYSYGVMLYVGKVAKPDGWL